MSALAENVPHFWVLAALALVALLVELSVVVLSLRRLKLLDSLGQRAAGGDLAPLAGVVVPSRLAELAAVIAPVGLLVMVLAALRTSRRMIWQAISGAGSPEERAGLLGSGMAGDLHTLLLGTACLAAVLLGACFAVGLAVSARLRARGLAHAAGLGGVAPDVAAVWARYPGPAPQLLVASLAAFLVLGLGPVLWSFYSSGLHRLRVMAGLVGVDPRTKGAAIDTLLTEVTQQLSTGLTLARIGTLLAGVLVAALAAARSPARSRARALGTPAELPGRGAWVLGAGLVAAAVALLVLARPLQRENQLPWPPFTMGSDRLQLNIDTPALIGPDEIQRAPVLLVGTAALSLNGMHLQQRELEEALWELRNRITAAVPGPFHRRLVFLCSRETGVARVMAALAATAHAGYTRPLLTFLRQEQTDRPMFGKRTRTVASAAAFSAVNTAEEAEEPTTLIEASQFHGCLDLATRLVELRRAGKDVTLVTGRP